MQDKKDQYAKAVCYFLAEQLRTKRLSLSRAAEIAERVVAHVNLIDTESDFLQLIKTLSSDFEELHSLTDRIQFNLQVMQREQVESKVREFAASCLPQDPHLALSVLQEAMNNTNFDYLCGKFPQFKEFTTTYGKRTEV